jgi:hypothetical protein
VADLGRPPNTMTVHDARRSTRISESVRLSVSGQNKVGTTFSELTLTLAVNCHGCIYPSRNEHRTGSWVTLEFPNQQSDPKPHPVRAQVKFVRAPRSSAEHYQVGVELEAPANLWRVESIPKDWLRFPVLFSGMAGAARATTPPAGPRVLDPHISSATAEPTRQTPTTMPDPGRPNDVASSPEQLLRTWEQNLQQAAEKAVASALTSHLNSAVNQAITAIDKFSQASVRQVEEYCARYQEKLITSARDGLLRRLQADLTKAEERLQKQLAVSLNEIQETSHAVMKTVTSEAHLVLAESVDFLKETSRELQGQYSAQLRETTDRASAELSAETVRFSDRQFALLTKQAQAAVGESSTLLEARATEARSQLETAATTMLSNFHRKASIEIDQASINVRQHFMSSLTSFADEVRAEWEAKQRAWQDEVACSNEQQCGQFRQKLDAILQSSMTTAISSIKEHSIALLNSLANKPEEQLREIAHDSASG